MTNKIGMTVVVLLTIGALGWLFHHFSDKEVIRRRVIFITESLGKEREESPLVLALQMRPVKEFLAEACQVEIPEDGYQEVLTPELAIRYLLVHRSHLTSLKVTVERMVIDIPERGVANLSATIRVQINRNEPAFSEDSHLVHLILHKGEKTWLLHRLTLPRALVRRH